MDVYLQMSSITRFLVEAVSFVLEYNNLSWEPPVSIHALAPLTTPLFTRNIGRALTHYCMNAEALEYGPDGRFYFNVLLELTITEAETHVLDYIFRYTNEILHDDYYSYLYLMSFICQLCFHSIRYERLAIIFPVLRETACILHSRCHYLIDYTNINQAAIEYCFYHTTMHDESDDEGFYTALEDEDDLFI